MLFSVVNKIIIISVGEHTNDIALVRIRRSGGHGIVFSDAVQPACVPEQDAAYPNPGTQCIISGWGTTAKGQDRLTLFSLFTFGNFQVFSLLYY